VGIFNLFWHPLAQFGIPLQAITDLFLLGFVNFNDAIIETYDYYWLFSINPEFHLNRLLPIFKTFLDSFVIDLKKE